MTNETTVESEAINEINVENGDAVMDVTDAADGTTANAGSAANADVSAGDAVTMNADAVSTEENDDTANENADDTENTSTEAETEPSSDISETNEQNDKDDDQQDPVETNDTIPEEEELWDLKTILSPTQLLSGTIFCSSPHCSLQACSVWGSNHDELWSCCLDCQAMDYGGWPEKVVEVPLKILRGEHWRMILERCTADPVNAIMPNIPTDGFDANYLSNEQDIPQNDDDDDDELWELKEILTPTDLSIKNPKICQSDHCSLLACCAWASNLEPESYWYTCLDCQATDFGGFPPNDELPVSHLSGENREVILKKCTQCPEKMQFPNIPTEPSLLATSGDNAAATITPPPIFNKAVANAQSNVVVGAASKKKSVTPVPLKDNNNKGGPPKKKEASKEALAIHRKWQAEAVKLGGPDAKIVVSKGAAKKLIFDMLHDAFRPMNITEIYQKLKAIVPSPILRACLDDMADTFQGNPFADGDSDDEENKPPKKKAKKSNDKPTEEYSGSLRLKAGRNTNNNLYYVDHTKLQNNGNGLDPDKRNHLFADLEKAKCEEEALKKQIQESASETARLLSEPLNDELTTLLVEREKEMEDLNEKLETNRGFAGNEKYVKKLSGRVSKMATIWRKRKRQCMEFLMLMEDSTEGTVSVKKCLKGDGQICIDSDESIIKGAKAYAATKKNSSMVRKSLNGRSGSGATAGLNPDPNFIGVILSSNGNPQRVFMDDN